MKEYTLAQKLNKRLFGILIDDIPSSELPADLTDTWQLVRLAAGSDHELFRAKLPITHEEVHVTFSREGLSRLKAGLQAAGLDAKFFEWPPIYDPNRAPYRGMRALEADDAGIFFGRDGPIVETMDRLRGLREEVPPRLLVILGARNIWRAAASNSHNPLTPSLHICALLDTTIRRGPRRFVI